MPELPEVETTRRGIAPHLIGRTVTGLTVRQPRLRWPVPAGLEARLRGRTITAVDRRGKYLLVAAGDGTMLLHLGMSGSLRIVPAEAPPRKHDHVDVALESGQCLRFHDPRRFGALLWTDHDPQRHPLLAALGPEPLADGFCGASLHRRSVDRTTPVKNFIMDSRVVAGVGNIYANEALFSAGVHPGRAAGRIAARRYERLADAIRRVLDAAIRQGGTTLRDFVDEAGNPGYFQQTLNVYGRNGQPCRRCHTPIRQIRLGQRSTFYCPRCQR